MGFFIYLLVEVALLISAIKPLDASAMLILNMLNEDALPRHFRTCQSPISSEVDRMPSLEGLDRLRISGSGQFSQLSWQSIKRATRHPGPFFDVDLREETHGFLNGSAISLYASRNSGNSGKSDAAIHQEEDAWLEELAKKETIILREVTEKEEGYIIKTKPLHFIVCEVSSEKNFMKQAANGYLRLYVTDHDAPATEDVDRFISFVRQLPLSAWVHFHCSAGQGRTTTFMCMYDIMHNAKKVPLEDILLRQHLIGGANLLKTYEPLFWKHVYANRKRNFLKNFYQYAQENQDGFATPWSAYLKSSLRL